MTMLLVPSAMAFFTSSRNSEDSSPNTIRPLHSRARIPSTVRFCNFNCIDSPLWPAGILLRPSHIRQILRHQPIACERALQALFASDGRESITLLSASSAALLSDICGQKRLICPPQLPPRRSRIIDSSAHELHRPGPQIPSSEVLRGHRTRARYPYAAKRHRTRTFRPWLHLQRASRYWQDDGRPHPGHGAELPLQRPPCPRTLRSLRILH